MIVQGAHKRGQLRSLTQIGDCAGRLIPTANTYGIRRIVHDFAKAELLVEPNVDQAEDLNLTVNAMGCGNSASKRSKCAKSKCRAPVTVAAHLHDGVFKQIGRVIRRAIATLARPRNFADNDGHGLLPQLGQTGTVAIDQDKVRIAPQCNAMMERQVA